MEIITWAKLWGRANAEAGRSVIRQVEAEPGLILSNIYLNNLSTLTTTSCSQLTASSHPHMKYTFYVHTCVTWSITSQNWSRDNVITKPEQIQNSQHLHYAVWQKLNMQLATQTSSIIIYIETTAALVSSTSTVLQPLHKTTPAAAVSV